MEVGQARAWPLRSAAAHAQHVSRHAQPVSRELLRAADHGALSGLERHELTRLSAHLTE